MSYGLPYLGSKNIYAKMLCGALPAGGRLVDLFAGGCAVTDFALKQNPTKWGTYLCRDLDSNPISLYSACLTGTFTPDFRWVSRAEFKDSQDWLIKLIWSYGYKTNSYIYGQGAREARCHDIHDYIVYGKVSEYSGLMAGLELPALPTIEERYKYWMAYRPMVGLLKCISTNSRYSRDYLRCQHLERTFRLLSLRQDIHPEIDFKVGSYLTYDYQEGDIVYCDIPYIDTTCVQYSEPFNHDAFWQWATSQPYPVYVSERTIPSYIKAEVVFKYDAMNLLNTKGCDGFKTEYLVKV